jgi:hypothetical protein
MYSEGEESVGVRVPVSGGGGGGGGGGGLSSFDEDGQKQDGEAEKESSSDDDGDLSGYDAADDLENLSSDNANGEECREQTDGARSPPSALLPTMSIADRITRRGLVPTTRHNRTRNFTEGTRLTRVKDDVAAMARGYTITMRTSAEFLNRITISARSSSATTLSRSRTVSLSPRM